MRPPGVEVGDVLPQRAPQVTGAEDDDVVEALASHRAEEPLTSGVDLRRAYGALDDAGAGSASLGDRIPRRTCCLGHG